MLSAGERLTAPPRAWRWKPWAWAAALCLHLLVIFLFLLFARERPPAEETSPPGIAVVFDHGGAPKAAAPPGPRHGPESVAEAPPPAAPPPAASVASAPPEVNLNMPTTPFAALQSAPLPALPPQPRQITRPQPRQITRPQPKPSQKYVVMNNMSYGHPAPPVLGARPALNLSLAQSDAQAANAPELTVKGNIGADWMAALSKWVNEHKYYPQAAAEQGQQGNASVEFTVDRAGNVTGVHLTASAGSPFLDQAWVQLFADNQLPAFPPGTKSDHVTVDATMHYMLIP
ncbi:MAG: TonB family protein [Acidocella sp.]|nr:TonB family protein [Acidocella sp.]